MADEMKIGEVSDIVAQMLSDDKAKMELYNKIDDAVGCVFKPDAAVAQLPFIHGRSFALTDIADARNAGTRVFSSLLPNITISPTADNAGEYERTDRMEQAWKWELERMNSPVNSKKDAKGNAKGIHDQIVESATTYHAVAFQTEYLPYKYKGVNNPRTKALLARKCFQWTVFHPGIVHRTTSDYGTEQVAKVAEYSAAELIQNFGRDNPGVQKILEENRSAKPAELMQKKYIHVDYTDWENRVQYAYPSGAGLGDSKIVFMNEKHGLPFINWVIVEYGEPLWQSVLESGHWNNLQHMKLIKFARAVAMGARPDIAIRSPDGKARGVWLDWSNPLNPLHIPAGTEVIPVQGNQLDPQFESEYQEDRQDVSRSTVARILQDPSQFLNAPFSTFNASITSALGQLSPAKRAAEAAEAEGIKQGFQWIKHSRIDFGAYRRNNKDAKEDGAQPYMRGQAIVITHADPPTREEFMKMSEQEQALIAQKVYFDLQNLYVHVELQSANITDEQAKLNTYIQAHRELNMASKEVWERMGWEGYEMNLSQSAMEQLFQAEVQKMVQAKMMELQAQMQQQQMAQQQQAAQTQQAQSQDAAINQMNAGSQMAGLQGVDMRQGGNPAAMTAPSENRVSITGQSDTGQPTL